MKRVVIVAVPLAFVVAASCSEPSDRPPAAPNCMGLTCGSGPGPGTSGGSDAGETSVTDASTDAPFEVGEAGVPVRAIVRPLASFTADPETSTMFDSTSMSVRAPRVGGGFSEATMADIEGAFTLTAVQPSIGAATYVDVWKSGVHRTHAAVLYRPEVTLNLPLFAAELPQVLWTQSGAMTAFPTTSSTVVVHVVGPTGARASGVKALPFGTGRGPYYDDGSDVSPMATTQTGARGTIVFLGLSGSFQLTLSTATKTYAAVTLTLSPGAVTYATFQVD